MQRISKLGFAVLLGVCAASCRARAAEQPVCDLKDAPKTLRPIMATHTLPPYPEMSVMTGEQGVTLMVVTIGADGVPTDVQVQMTSGSIRLDEAARDFVKQNWRWEPFAGCVGVRTRVSVKWDVRDAPRAAPNFLTVAMKPQDFPPGALARHEKGAVAMIVGLRPGGQSSMVKIVQGSGFPDLDEQSLAYAKLRHWTPGLMDEIPVFTIFQLVLSWGMDEPQAKAPN